MIERNDRHGPLTGDEEMLADAVERVTRRLQSDEPIDPADDIPRPLAQASRIRALVPTIRDLVDLGRARAATAGIRRPAAECLENPSPRGDSRGADPTLLVTEFAPDA